MRTDEKSYLNEKAKYYKRSYDKEIPADKQRLEEILNRKDYLITVYECGDKLMSGGDIDKEVMPRRYWQEVSLIELREMLNDIYVGFWTHPDLNKDTSNYKDIPFEERKWGMISNIIVEPLSEKFEKQYVEASKRGFFNSQRMLSEYRKDKSKYNRERERGK